MAENKSITLSEIAEMLGLTLGAIEKSVRKMQNAGEIRHNGPNKGGEWEVLQWHDSSGAMWKKLANNSQVVLRENKNRLTNW